MKTYPECDKLLAVKNQSQAQGEFLDWLSDKGIALCEIDQNYYPMYVPVRKNTETLLAEYHGIDLNKVEKERKEMLEDLKGIV